MKKALFLDRDGVINVDKNYVIRKSDMEFIDGIFKLVRTANFAGYMVIVITNQSGIGRNMYTVENFIDLSNWMKLRFLRILCPTFGVTAKNTQLTQSIN